jgi:hypothetical protein
MAVGIAPLKAHSLFAWKRWRLTARGCICSSSTLLNYIG